jgi:Flp pilus assembly protein TadG
MCVRLTMMRTMSLRLFSLLREFASERRGNVAIIFAFALIPIIGFVGAAIDYSRGNVVKVEMQSALDSVGLMLYKTAPTLSVDQLQSAAQSYFSAVFAGRYGANNIKVSATYSTTGGSNVVVNASADVPTTFMGIFGFKEMTVSSSTTAKWGYSRLRVALVLDNTGSMSQSGKMTALQTATNNLLTQLQNAASVNGDVYVSIVPFVKDVNLVPTNYSANWIDWTDWNANNGSCSNSYYHTQSSCTSHSGSWTVANHNTWNGCVVDRGNATQPNPANYDTNVVEPTTSITATLFSAEQYSSCPQAAMGLSYDWSSMTNLVNGMSPAGNTNQAIGLALGWMSLVGGGPFTAPAMDPNYKYQQAIILLTDGLNTQDRWYTSQWQIDAREQMTCDNIKAAGIILFTIQVNTGGDPTSTLLQNCASNTPGTTDHFFLLTSASQIVTTFNQIGTNLTQLYIAK